MQRLRGMDATFFYMETPTTHMHVVGALVLDPSTAPGGYGLDTVRALIESRIHLMPPFRRRLVEVPLGLDHPRWIEDPDFDIDNHLLRVALPTPADQRALETFVADFAGRPLDRSRPLWELVLVEGLDDDNVALVTKMHHAAIDGVSGADLMVHLFDLERAPAEVEPPTEPWTPDEVPSDVELITEGLANQAANPARMLRQVTKTLGSLTDVIGRIGNDAAVLPFTAPQTPWNGALTAQRSVAFSRSPLADVKAVKNAFGCKINDVVLAATTQTLRAYLLAHGEPVETPLVASCPVSVRTDEEVGEVNNRISSMFVSLPVQLDDPLDQLDEIVAATTAAKELHAAVGADALQDWAEVMTPGLFTLAMRSYSQLSLADRHRPVQNLVVSNVPGPPVPLYSAGATVQGVYPLGPLIEGAGMNLTVISNMGNLDAAVIACREMVPDPWLVTDGFAEGIAVLLELAG